MKKEFFIACYASGSGTGIHDVLEKLQKGTLYGFYVPLIITNRKNVGVYDVAKKHHIRIEYAPSPEKQLALLQECTIDLVVCLGYDYYVKEPVLSAYENLIINIHPTLLPKYGGKGMVGLNTHKAVLSAGETYTGVTIHKVIKDYDKGGILYQLAIPIPPPFIEEGVEAAQKLQDYNKINERSAMADFLMGVVRGRYKWYLPLPFDYSLWK